MDEAISHIGRWQGKALRIHDAQRGTRARLLSDTAREGRGIGHQGGDVSALHAS